MRQRPDWDALFDVASQQDGYFTTSQAAAAGYSRPLLAKYIANGRIARSRRGVYRLVHYPPGEHEDLSVLWLWSDQQGVFSHETALALHELSDVLPAKIHMTLPSAWARRRLRAPAGVVLHHADVPASDRRWIGSVPVTNPARTIADCRDAHVSPDLVAQALRQARERGLLDHGRLRSRPRREADS